MRIRSLLAGILAASLASAACAQVAPISGLPAATTPLTGAELVPCVQGGAVSKCTAASLGSGLAGCSPSSTCSVSGAWSFSDAIITGGSINGTPIGVTTPAAGAFTTLSASGLISPTSSIGIKGTTAADNAQAGSDGEYICAQVTNGGSPTGCATNSNVPVSLTNAVPTNITSISLTAGDWDVWGSASFLPAGSTVTINQGCWVSTQSATNVGAPNGGAFVFLNNLPNSQGANINTYYCGMQRVSVSSTTTVFVEAFAGFNTSTETAYGFIGARRVR